MVGECGCSSATRSTTAPFWLPRSFGRAESAAAPVSNPLIGWVASFERHWPSGTWLISSPVLDHRLDAQAVLHTQAVQPSYNWARLSKLVASLMTKSTCEEKRSKKEENYIFSPSKWCSDQRWFCTHVTQRIISCSQTSKDTTSSCYFSTSVNITIELVTPR